MSIFVLCKKDLEGFDLIIFENLDKSLEYVCDGIPIQQNEVHDTLYRKEPSPETYSWHFSLQLQWGYCLSNFLTG